MSPDEKITWMRDNGVIQAAWTVDGELSMAIVGPEPVSPQDFASPTQKHEEPSLDELLTMSAG